MSATVSTRNSSDACVALPTKGAGLPVPSEGLAHRMANALRSVHPAVAPAPVALIGLVAIVSAALLAGVFIREVVSPGTVGGWDRDISRWLADARTESLTRVSYVGSHLAGIREVPIAMTLLVGVLFAMRRPWWGSFLLIGILLEGAQYVSVTYLFARSRPDVQRLEGLIADDSFPSGHAAAAVVMYCGLALIISRATKNRVAQIAAWSFAIACVLVVAISRVYRGMHYTTDVITGVLIGTACLVVASLAVRVGALVAEARTERRA